MAVPTRRDGRRTDKRTGPNLPADTDIDDVEDQENDDQDGEDEQDESVSDDEQDQAAGKREARYRKQRNDLRAELRQVREELATLKAKADEAPKADKRTRRAQEELAFVKAAAAEGVQEVEAAWKLCDREMLTWEEDDDEPPRLSGIEDALDHVLDRYPYVAGSRTDDDEDDDRVQPPGPTTSGKPTNGPRKGPKGLDRAYLEKKYPSLQRSRRRLL